MATSKMKVISKKKILVFVAYYLPGYESGGPVRSIANMVDHLSEHFDFRIVTLDRDALDTVPYQNIKANAWNKVGPAQVYYISLDNLTLFNITRLIRKTSYDILYLNSFFSCNFTVYPLLARWLKILPSNPVVLAPRGEFSQGALAIKQQKKKLYLALARIIGLYRGLIWQASSAHEGQDILRALGSKIANRVIVAPNLSTKLEVQATNSLQSRQPGGPLRVVFLSRISPKKNLDYALETLKLVNVSIKFDIYGPLREEDYWQRCQRIIKKLPANIEVNYRGSIEHKQVAGVLGSYDLFFLPTAGENFGHVILESMLAGTPVLISDKTPWRDLNSFGVGWDIPLTERERFVQAIEKSAAMGVDEFMFWRTKVNGYGIKIQQDLGVIKANQALFLKV